MGLDPFTLALATLATAATVKGAIDSRNAGKQIQKEQKASNARDAALERRSQIREARIRRAQILQSSENTGTTGSSGLIGAEMAVSTNLASNIGNNVGALQSANNISIFQQDLADAQFLSNMGQVLASTASYTKKT